MITGESILSGAAKTCETCGETPEMKVYKSNAGHYIGTYCNCGPYTRESIYFPLEEAAQWALDVAPPDYWRRTV